MCQASCQLPGGCWDLTNAWEGRSRTAGLAGLPSSGSLLSFATCFFTLPIAPCRSALFRLAETGFLLLATNFAAYSQVGDEDDKKCHRLPPIPHIQNDPIFLPQFLLHYVTTKFLPFFVSPSRFVVVFCFSRTGKNNHPISFFFFLNKDLRELHLLSSIKSFIKKKLLNFNVPKKKAS